MKKLTIRVEPKAASKLERLALEQNLNVGEYVRDVLNEHVVHAENETDIQELKEETKKTLALLQDEIQRLRSDLIKQSDKRQQEFQKHLEQGVAHELDVHTGEMKKLMSDFLKAVQATQGAQTNMGQGFPDYRKVPSSR